MNRLWSEDFFCRSEQKMTMEEKKLISPNEYIKRLKMPAMLTDLRGNIAFANRAMTSLLTQKCRRKLYSSLIDITGEQLVDTLSGGGGRIVELDNGVIRIKLLVLSDGNTARWYHTKFLANSASISSPEVCNDWIINCTSDTERDMLSEKQLSPAQIFYNSAYFTHIGYRPKRELSADEFCRFLILSTFFLIGSNRVIYGNGIASSTILKSPKKAFFAASEMIDKLLKDPLGSWQAFATARGFVMTDGTVKLHAGGCLTTNTHSSSSEPFLFSYRTAATVAAAVSSAEMAIFEDK